MVEMDGGMLEMDGGMVLAQMTILIQLALIFHDIAFAFIGLITPSLQRCLYLFLSFSYLLSLNFT